MPSQRLLTPESQLREFQPRIRIWEFFQLFWLTRWQMTATRPGLSRKYPNAELPWVQCDNTCLFQALTARSLRACDSPPWQLKGLFPDEPGCAHSTCHGRVSDVWVSWSGTPVSVPRSNRQTGGWASALLGRRKVSEGGARARWPDWWGGHPRWVSWKPSPITEPTPWTLGCWLLGRRGLGVSPGATSPPPTCS